MKILPFIIIAFFCYCSSSPKQNTGNDTTVNQNLQQDFHTTYTDVIDNFFLAINKKDWPVADSFYIDTLKQKSLYFKNFFEKGHINSLQLINISKKNDTVYTRTSTGSTEFCFEFLIANNRIIYQKLRACNY